MDIVYPGFGVVVVNGTAFDRDVVIDRGTVRTRDKSPSRARKAGSGHTPLSVDEALPWSEVRLVIGSGYSGRLPILPEVHERAAELDIELLVMPTAAACQLLRTAAETDVNAVLHVTC